MVLETHETRRKLNLFSGACRTGKLHVGRYVMLNSSPGVCCMFHQIAEGRRGVGVMTAAKPKAVGGRLRIACIHKLAGYLSSSAHPVAICRLFRVQLASFVATALLQHSSKLRARLLPTRPRNHTPINVIGPICSRRSRSRSRSRIPSPARQASSRLSTTAPPPTSPRPPARPVLVARTDAPRPPRPPCV
jgi:hypothetical protein